MLAGLIDILISVPQINLSEQNPELLLVGYNLYVVGGCSESEGKSFPVSDIDLIDIHLDAAILAALVIARISGFSFIAASTKSGILILLDLQVIGSSG